MLSVFIRPHILLFLFIAYGLAMVFDARIRLHNKIFLYIIFIGIFLALLPRVMDFANLENLNTEAIENYSNEKAGELASKEHTGSAIDISGYPYPFKVFTFLFRPFFIDMPTMSGIAASCENVFFLLFFFKVFQKNILSGFWSATIIIRSLLFFFIIGSLVFPLILGNLGIIIRQKTPFVMTFIIFGYWSIMNYYSVKAVKRKIILENTALH